MFQSPWILPWGMLSLMPSSVILPGFSSRVQFCVWRTKSLIQTVSRNRTQTGKLWTCLDKGDDKPWQLQLQKDQNSRSKLFPKASCTPGGIHTHRGSRWLKHESSLLPAIGIDPAAAAAWRDSTFPARNQCGGSPSIPHLTHCLEPLPHGGIEDS